jgi:protein-disulfide isomerase
MRVRSALLLLAALTATSYLAAASPPTSQLRTYLERSFGRCPGAKIQMKREASSPRGFVAYKVRLTSSVEECGRQADFLFSTTGNQVLFVNLFALPSDSRPLEARLTDFGQSVLKKSVRVSIGKNVLEDGLRAVTFFTNGKVGPFELHGYTDASGSFLIVGRRGHLNVDPRAALLADLPSTSLRQGKQDAAIQIVELSDLQCPTCKQAHELLTKFVEANVDRVSYTRIDLPIFDIHEWTLSASLAARAIQRLSPQHYWQFVDYIFQNQAVIESSMVDTFIHDFVDGNGIDRQKFDALYNSPVERAALVHQIEHLFDISIATAPTVLVNGQEIFFGSQGSYLRGYLNSLLAKGK